MFGRRVVAFVFVGLPLAAQHGSTTAINPYTAPEDALAGAKLFRAQCAGCHGPEGAGTGAGPSLTSGRFRRGGSDEALFQSISKGVPGTSMPAFAFTGLQIWQLVTHVRTMNIARGTTRAKGDAKSGSILFQEKCSGCHVVAGQGGFQGPDLTFVGSRRTYDELQTSLSEPDSEVAPDYWSVIIKTNSGQLHRGVRLNEDTHSIQIRDENGRLISVLKREVEGQELIRRSSMPVFAGKLSDSQLADVLAYLTTLKEER
jgi:putative heme-binding domain-containing protein